MARLRTLVAVTLALFTAVGVWEWAFYAQEAGPRRSSWAVVRRAQPRAGEGQPERLSAKRERPPRRTGLQALVDADQQLPLGPLPTHHAPDPSGSFAAPAAPLPAGRLTPTLPDAAVIVFCFNRAAYLEQTLASLAGLPGLADVTVYVSQDGNDSAVAALAQRFVATALAPPRTRRAEHWQHPRTPLLGEAQLGHAWLSQHYRWGLARLFEARGHSHAIILEDDMLLSADLLPLFAAAAPLLDSDPSLWCISSWNDNGLAHLNWRNDRLFRTSYFPGLGWMLRRQLWAELAPRFPPQAWDHWMRLDSTALGRECAAPEVSRNRNIGERGANMQRSTFKRYLARMGWSRQPVADWGDLSYLRLDTYETELRRLLGHARAWDRPLSVRSVQEAGAGQVWLLPYVAEEYPQLARAFQIWPFPRGHHRHLTVLRHQGSTFLLADRRFCPLLGAELRVRPHAALRATPGPAGVDCNAVCRGAGMRCRGEDFWFINTCAELQRHFPCERGCAVELGPDVPNYVTGRHLPTFQACLITQSGPQCSAAHPHTRRLCPCVGPEPGRAL